MVTVKKGDVATLQCEVNGDKPINVVWLKNGKHELTPSTNYRSILFYNYLYFEFCWKHNSVPLKGGKNLETSAEFIVKEN